MKVEERLDVLQKLPMQQFYEQNRDAIAFLKKKQKEIEKIGINLDPQVTQTYYLIRKTIKMLKDVKQHETEKIKQILTNFDEIKLNMRQIYLSDAALLLLER